MKIIHAFQLRAEAKHTSRQRQLSPRILWVTIGTLVFHVLSALGAEPSARDELRAAELMETALIVRQASAEDWRKMAKIFADLVAKYPQDAEVKNGQAEFFWNQDDRARAMEAWLAAEKLDPKNAVVLDHLGGSYMAAGDARKAAEYHARATAISPENATYHFNYANVAFLFRHDLLSAAHPDAAAVLRLSLTHFAEASRLQPLNSEYARAYAETFYTMPDPDWKSALQAWQHFYEISPGKDAALVNLARVQLKLGNKPEAREALDRVKTPEFDRLKARLKERIEAE